MNEFLQRLKQRKLVQWAVAYVAAAFALLQGVDIVAQRFGWPEQTMRFVIIALCVGFFVTLVLAWYHGERGAQRVNGTELLILALLLALGGGLLWRFAAASGETSAESTSLPNDSKISAMPAAVPEKSIAVLPFENLSADRDNVYFATGMQDEILTRLAGIRDLKVISSSSTEQYASRPPNLKIVAEQLGVATVLEGSVQKAGAAVHINVQLLDARSDSHLWAESYDRDLKDIFGVQRDVAEKVADALKAQLLPAESARIASVPTQNPEAYDLYLRAEHYMHEALLGDWAKALPAAAEAYQQALTQDPKFALAWARRSGALSLRNYFGLDISAENMRLAEANAQRALALAPDLPEAHLAMGYVYRIGHHDLKAARAEYLRALQARPNDADTIANIAYIDADEGEIGAAIAGLERATALNPRDANLAIQLARAYTFTGDYSKVRQALMRALAIDPKDAEAYEFLSRNEAMMTGDARRALALLDSMPPGTPENSDLAQLRIQLLLYGRDFPAARQAAGALSDKTSADSLFGAMARGNVEWLAGARAQALPFYRVAIDRAHQQLASNPDDFYTHAALGLALARSGNAHDARIQGDLAVSVARRQNRIFVLLATLNLIEINLAIGDDTAANTQIEQFMATPLHEGVLSATLLKLDPTWDPLRKNPRFQKVVADGEAAQAQDQTKP